VTWPTHMCNTLQCTATFYNVLQRTATLCQTYTIPDVVYTYTEYTMCVRVCGTSVYAYCTHVSPQMSKMCCNNSRHFHKFGIVLQQKSVWKKFPRLFLLHNSIHGSTLRYFVLKPGNSNSHGFELHRLLIKDTPLLLKIIEAIIIITVSSFSSLWLQYTAPHCDAIQLATHCNKLCISGRSFCSCSTDFYWVILSSSIQSKHIATYCAFLLVNRWANPVNVIQSCIYYKLNAKLLQSSLQNTLQYNLFF